MFSSPKSARLKNLYACTVFVVIALFPAAAECADKEKQTVSGGTFTDSRDSKTYKTVKIGNQTWMAENLNYETLNGEGSWCYENSADSCTKYGRLYNWNTAMVACPAGWHLATREDWDGLVTAAGGSSAAGTKFFKLSTGWNSDSGVPFGADTCGFSALPGGYRSSSGDFYGAGDYGYWWPATESSSVYAYIRNMFYNIEGVVEDYYDFKGGGNSVRCVRD